MSTTPKKICIITQSHLCRNPRVLKEAKTLSETGYEVHVINSVYSSQLAAQDDELIKDCPIYMHHAADLTRHDLPSFIDKLIFKVSRKLIKFSHIENHFALGYGSYKYYKLARLIQADFYSFHQELATFTGNKLLRAGYKVAFDFEDWYSEDLLPGDQRSRPVKLLKRAEAFALQNGTFCTTTSAVLAEKLSTAYSCKAPEVIYNVFPLQNDLLNKKKAFGKPLQLFWFSQTIGPGRGLEEFISLTNNFQAALELHLLGSISDSYRDRLKALMPPRHQVFFHELVPEKELAAKIATFDIGLALELTSPPSRNYTITNKFFQYLQAGLPVIASVTAGQEEAFEKFRPGFMLSTSPDATEITALNEWLNSPVQIADARQRAIEAAHFYNWENESVKLINLVKNALESAG